MKEVVTQTRENVLFEFTSPSGDVPKRTCAHRTLIGCHIQKSMNQGSLGTYPVYYPVCIPNTTDSSTPKPYTQASSSETVQRSYGKPETVHTKSPNQVCMSQVCFSGQGNIPTKMFPCQGSSRHICRAQHMRTSGVCSHCAGRSKLVREPTSNEQP